MKPYHTPSACNVLKWKIMFGNQVLSTSTKNSLMTKLFLTNSSLLILMIRNRMLCQYFGKAPAKSCNENSIDNYITIDMSLNLINATNEKLKLMIKVFLITKLLKISQSWAWRNLFDLDSLSSKDLLKENGFMPCQYLMISLNLTPQMEKNNSEKVISSKLKECKDTRPPILINQFGKFNGYSLRNKSKN